MEAYFNIIGKNYDTTLKYINDSGKSEYYIPAASDQMPYSEVKKNYNALLEQINFFLDKMNGANKKSIENLSKILDIKNSLVADYEKKILVLPKLLMSKLSKSKIFPKMTLQRMVAQ